MGHCRNQIKENSAKKNYENSFEIYSKRNLHKLVNLIVLFSSMKLLLLRI